MKTFIRVNELEILYVIFFELVQIRFFEDDRIGRILTQYCIFLRKFSETMKIGLQYILFIK